MTKSLKNKGFTLIEVLAALMVFSLSIVGLVHAGTQSAKTVSAIDEKILAGIVADNQIVLARTSRLVLGVQSGEARQMAKDFNYRLETRTTEVPGFYTIIVQISKEGSDHILVERTAFRGANS